MGDLQIGGTTIRSKTVRDQIMMFPELVTAGASVEIPSSTASRVCIFGVDTTSIAGDIVADMSDELSDSPVPMICDSRIPGWIGSDTVCIVISYKGIGRKMARVCTALVERGCTVYVLTSYGLTAEGCIHIPVPENLDERVATGYVLGAVCRIIQSMGVFDAADAVMASMDDLRTFIEGLDADTVDAIRDSVRGRVPAFYATSDIHACAKSWKEAVEQSTGGLSFYGELPEFDHNELVGWSDENVHAPELSMQVVRGDARKALVSTIVECMVEVLEENGRTVRPVNVGDGSATSRDLRGVLLGFIVSETMEAV